MLQVVSALDNLIGSWNINSTLRPDGQIFRSTDSGATWSPLWEWISYPTLAKYYTYSDALAPWLGNQQFLGLSIIVLTILYFRTWFCWPDSWRFANRLDDGVLVLFSLSFPFIVDTYQSSSALSIDPFDSDHFLYGTGATIYGSHDLTQVCCHCNDFRVPMLTHPHSGIPNTWLHSNHWQMGSKKLPCRCMFQRKRRPHSANTPQNIVAPPVGPLLLSVVGDIEGKYR